MRRTTIAAIVLALAAATATASHATPKLIFRVDKVTAAIINRHLVVSVSGAVETGGWSQPRLHLEEPRPTDVNTETIQFLAVPPAQDTVVIQALLPKTVTAVFPLPRTGITQVKVEAESNYLIAPIAPEPVVVAVPATPSPSP
ncbi:MAG TPA: hypothetical protein VG387_13520 [Rhizomicrobium sp.]|nr:hypothetical protein [Rhizomicrobium sp.]